uniref:Uncharacterized protein n=1 Tax=Anopheles atroparvus TaxID=41427 RepID=A0AAG5DPS7_ANOAO
MIPDLRRLERLSHGNIEAAEQFTGAFVHGVHCRHLGQQQRVGSRTTGGHPGRRVLLRTFRDFVRIKGEHIRMLEVHRGHLFDSFLLLLDLDQSFLRHPFEKGADLLVGGFLHLNPFRNLRLHVLGVEGAG